MRIPPNNSRIVPLNLQLERKRPLALPLLGERGRVRGTAIASNQNLNREGTFASDSLRFMGRGTDAFDNQDSTTETRLRFKGPMREPYRHGLCSR